MLIVALLNLASVASAVPYDDLLTKDDIGPNKIPHLGTSRILVIPSRVGTTAFPAGRWAQLVQRFATAGGEGTFRRYWQIVSNGRYDPVPTLVKPVLFPDSCPLPGKDLSNCSITLTPADAMYLLNGAGAAAITKVIERVRDEQSLDLQQFDINSGSGQKPDGYFDGVIVDTDLYHGVALPLAALQNELAIPAAGPTDPRKVKLGILAFAPPEMHEFFHTFGLIDLYGGPQVNDLLWVTGEATPCAFSRQQLGWSDVIKVTGPGSHLLKPTLDGGSVLRFGDWNTRYLLLENRGGSRHSVLGKDGPAGLYIYSIDESTLPTFNVGFLDFSSASGLYLPNANPPYLCVNMPLHCSFGAGAMSCALSSVGDERRLVHAMGEDTGLSVRVDSLSADGQIGLSILGAVPVERRGVEVSSLDRGGPPDSRPDRRRADGRGPEVAAPGCSCEMVPAGGGWPLVLLGLGLLCALRATRGARRGP